MKKVLIIDDENRTRDLVKKMIDSFNFPLQVFAEGENVSTGIEAINRIKPDILFLDIQMPDGTGFDVLNKATKIRSNASGMICSIAAFPKKECSEKAIKTPAGLK